VVQVQILQLAEQRQALLKISDSISHSASYLMNIGGYIVDSGVGSDSFN